MSTHARTRLADAAGRAQNGAMRTALFLAASTLSMAAHAAITVEFVEPEKYTDIGRLRHVERDAILTDLGAHFMKLGKGLPADLNLTIEVLDIDLAGEERFLGASAIDVRVQRGRADWPSMRLRYTLERDGRKETREERISDMTYQQRVQPVNPTETLPHEKRMLTDWFNSLKLSAQSK